ncbi:hypothetical protein ACIBG7_21435 [Nonomuraea sp. NPDC050328]|uniref:hypothetical protein n=1 Tax=Nonomuraea sp. NPDC050328 TaxID=3364361 RepID=UPI0037B98416
MFHRIRAAVVALAVGAGALALAPAAGAAAAAAPDPELSKLSVSPDTLDVTAAPGRVTVTFDSVGYDTASIRWSGPGSPADASGPTKTGTSGDKTSWKASAVFDADNAGDWTVAVTARKSGIADNTNTATFKVTVKSKLDTKIVDFDADPDAVRKGGTIIASGQLKLERSGWKGYEGQPVKITFRAKGTDAYAHITTTTTGRDGWFRARVKAETTGWWRAEFLGNDKANGSVSDSDGVSVGQADSPSRLSFDAYPEPVDKGDELNFKGTLQVLGGHGWDGRSGYRVSIQFRADGSRHWEHVTSAVTGRHGRYGADATAVTSGWWRAVFAGAHGVDGSTSSGDWVRVERPTPPPPPDKLSSSLVSFNAYPEPVKRGKWLHFKGRLLVNDGGWEGYEAQVGLYKWSKGKWRFVKTTWSNDNGYLHTKVKASTSGYWKFYFRGDSDAKADSSRKDYVKVKK